MFHFDSAIFGTYFTKISYNHGHGGGHYHHDARNVAGAPTVIVVSQNVNVGDAGNLEIPELGLSIQCGICTMILLDGYNLPHLVKSFKQFPEIIRNSVVLHTAFARNKHVRGTTEVAKELIEESFGIHCS